MAVPPSLDETYFPRGALWISCSIWIALVVMLRSSVGFVLGMFALPFFWVGAYAAVAYVILGRRPPLTYAAELLGGAAGAITAPLLMRAFGEEALVKDIPLGRAGEPEDIGRAAVFLLSDDAAWITGKILRVDGGVWM